MLQRYEEVVWAVARTKFSMALRRYSEESTMARVLFIDPCSKYLTFYRRIAARARIRASYHSSLAEAESSWRSLCSRSDVVVCDAQLLKGRWRWLSVARQGELPATRLVVLCSMPIAPGNLQFLRPTDQTLLRPFGVRDITAALAASGSASKASSPT